MCYVCRVGYMTVNYADQVVTNYSRAQIPLETFIVDNQYADGYMDFTFSDGYPQQAFRAFVDKLHAKGQRWVRILAPVASDIASLPVSSAFSRTECKKVSLMLFALLIAGTDH